MTLGAALAGKNNALNALRLLFAVLVITSHSFAFTGHEEPRYAGLSLGGWAVAGFFAISGYLIPRARLHTDLGTFLLRRGRRIYPAFWACCAIIAFVFSPLAAHLTGTPYSPRPASGYVIANASTYMAQVLIGTETSTAPPDLIMWNGSAWTLVFEVVCYVIAGALLTFNLVRRHHTTTAATIFTMAAASAMATGSQSGLPWFVTFFAAGWIVSSRCDHLTPTRAKTLTALALAAAAALVHPALAAIPLAYAVLGAGALLPIRWFTTNDISYGTYLYGWPIQQVLLIVGVGTLGVPVFIAGAVVLSLAAGAASWCMLERHCLPRRSRAAEPAPRLAVTQPA